MRHARWFVLMVVLPLVGCGESTPVRPLPSATPVVTLPADARVQVEQFCGNCHPTPKPASFPRDQWPHEVERGFEFYLLSGRTDLTPPPRAAVIAYFQSTAPERLEIVPAATPEQPARFHKQEVLWPEPARPNAGRPEVAIAHIQILPPRAGQMGRDFLLCDMKGGEVSQATLTGRTLRIRQLTKLHNPAHVCPTDLDADGMTDYLVCDLGSFLPEDHARGRVIWLRPPSGDLESPWETVTLLENVGRVADAQPADFDGDGDLDVIVAAFGWYSSGSVTLLRRTGIREGKPLFETETLDKRNGAIHVPTTDLNGDGRQDFVALLAQEHEAVEAFLSRSDGKFDKQVLYRAPDPSYGSSGIELVDLDGDGDQDVLYTNGDTFDSFYVKPYHSIRWIENCSDGSWKDHLLAPLPGVHRAVAGDLDGDGDLDIAACCMIASSSRQRQPDIERWSSIVWLEQRDGDFELHEIEADHPDHACLSLSDLNGDGALDLIVGNFGQPVSASTPPVTIWFNRGNAN